MLNINLIQNIQILYNDIIIKLIPGYIQQNIQQKTQHKNFNKDRFYHKYKMFFTVHT